MSLTIQLTRISPTHHRFSYQRANGSGETLEFETKSFLFHDLLHFAVESEARLQQGFYGSLALGKHYGELTEGGMDAANIETMTIEQAVGVMTGVIKMDALPAQGLEGLRNLFEALGKEIPTWFDESFITNVKERMRKLQGEWQALPFGEKMILVFEQA